ncbi:hypothetical protein E3N88_44768 [Mikania micrantha]|uniref:Uncharacterized protein n=1 Tax=Mikania micrantha TaxID=192012 RepID=A0A5N6LB23_9ASTR|nr:hypothetical protein E3N88_44768 [Mikania micrantha]
MYNHPRQTEPLVAGGIKEPGASSPAQNRCFKMFLTYTFQKQESVFEILSHLNGYLHQEGLSVGRPFGGTTAGVCRVEWVAHDGAKVAALEAAGGGRGSA